MQFYLEPIGELGKFFLLCEREEDFNDQVEEELVALRQFLSFYPLVFPYSKASKLLNRAKRILVQKPDLISNSSGPKPDFVLSSLGLVVEVKKLLCPGEEKLPTAWKIVSRLNESLESVKRRKNITLKKNVYLEWYVGNFLKKGSRNKKKVFDRFAEKMLLHIIKDEWDENDFVIDDVLISVVEVIKEIEDGEVVIEVVGGEEIGARRKFLNKYLVSCKKKFLDYVGFEKHLVVVDHCPHLSFLLKLMNMMMKESLFRGIEDITVWFINLKNFYPTLPPMEWNYCVFSFPIKQMVIA